MKKKRTQVIVLGRDKSDYKLKLPYLNIPIIVNRYIYKKMLKSDQFQFLGRAYP